MPMQQIMIAVFIGTHYGMRSRGASAIDVRSGLPWTLEIKRKVNERVGPRVSDGLADALDNTRRRKRQKGRSRASGT